MELDVRLNHGKLVRCLVSNKYDHSDHIKVLAELTILYQLVNETQVKINMLNKQLAKIDELKKAEDEIPF